MTVSWADFQIDRIGCQEPLQKAKLSGSSRRLERGILFPGVLWVVRNSRKKLVIDTAIELFALRGSGAAESIGKLTLDLIVSNQGVATGAGRM